MPSAEPDAAARFVADLRALTAAAGLRENARLGIALSGGPDSTALLLLATRAGMAVEAMTVDHGLRPESAAEAAAAAGVCRRLDVRHETARVRLDRPTQAAAREARYAALADCAHRRGLAAVLTGHHADDQAETLLMRLARGAGLAGLSGIRAVQRCQPPTASGPLLVLRPLLGWRKRELEAIVAAAGIEPARDPSNADPRYDRTAARALLATAEWLDPTRLAAAAAHLAEAETALAALAADRYAPEIADGEATLRPDPLPEFCRRHLRRLLSEQFGARPDGPALERALAALRSGHAVTCADVLCRVDGSVWRFRRAPPRKAPSQPPS